MDENSPFECLRSYIPKFEWRNLKLWETGGLLIYCEQLKYKEILKRLKKDL